MINTRHANPELIRSKWRAASKKYESKDRRRNKTLRSYGLTETVYNAMLDDQGGRCLICNEKLTLVVDHDHSTGRIRGLLCNMCNVGLGCFKDDVDKLTAAIVYLQQPR